MTVGGEGVASSPGDPPPDAGMEGIREREFPRLGSGIYLNAASAGVLPVRTVESVTEVARLRQRPGEFPARLPGRILRRARVGAARLVGGEADEITLSPNTSYGINLGAACAAAGDPGVIVVSEGEFPANVYPWLALEERGFRVERIPVDARGWPREGALLERIRADDVRALAVSAVQFHNGYLADLRRLGSACRAEGVLFVVDAIQAAGVVPLDVEAMRIDVLAAGGHKWLCSPFGSGFAWVRAELRSRFDPPAPSWLAYADSRDFSSLVGYGRAYVPDGRKFELATLGVQDHGGLAASVELLLEVGIEAIREHVRRLQEPVLEWASSRGDVEAATPPDVARRAGIVAFRGDAVRPLAFRLKDAGVDVAVREGLLRFAPHLYNTAEEIDQVVEVLEGA